MGLACCLNIAISPSALAQDSQDPMHEQFTSTSSALEKCGKAFRPSLITKQNGVSVTSDVSLPDVLHYFDVLYEITSLQGRPSLRSVMWYSVRPRLSDLGDPSQSRSVTPPPCYTLVSPKAVLSPLLLTLLTHTVKCHSNNSTLADGTTSATVLN